MCNFITRSNASVKRAVYRSEETRWKLSSLRGLTGINERITRCMAGKFWKLQKVGIATPPLPLVLFVWVEREDVPGTATHGHHNLITSGYGDKLSRSTSEPLPLDGRLSRLLAAKSDRGRSLCTVAGFISNFSELDPATGRTRKSRRENRPECGFIYSYLSTRWKSIARNPRQ